METVWPLQQVAASRRAVLKCIPAHCGISGNEQENILAKEDARGEHLANNVSFSEKKTLVRVLTMPRSQRDDYHLLSRKQQVVLVRLRAGHNRLNSHMHGKLKLAPSTFYKDAPFTKLQEKMCGLSALPWRPNSTAANRSWRRRRLSSPEQP